MKKLSTLVLYLQLKLVLLSGEDIRAKTNEFLTFKIVNDRSHFFDICGTIFVQKLFEPVGPFVTIEGHYTQEELQTRPTRVLIHGWNIMSNSFPKMSTSHDFQELIDTYNIYYKDFNIIMVKWASGSYRYSKAREYAESTVAHKVSSFLDKNLGTNETIWSNLKIIGHSIGAHIAGFVGKRVKNGKVGAIVGLDPAKPGYVNRNEKYRLAKADADYVECIHTGSDCYGIEEPICAVNFYPNTGKEQPGCYGYQCDHARAYVYFAESLVANKFISRKCDNFPYNCYGSKALMGGEPGNKDNNVEEGSYLLATNSKRPFGMA